METIQQYSPFKNRKNFDSITLKLMIVGLLVVILLIPSTWISKLVEERQSRAQSVVKEISGKWSDAQTLSGPVLVLPYTVTEKIKKYNDEIEIRESVEKAFFLPDKLVVNGEVNPQELHRGIFEAVVYNSSLDVRADFDYPNIKALNIAEENIHWEDACMIFAMSDIGGISKTPAFLVGQEEMQTEPTAKTGILIKNYLPEETTNARKKVVDEFSENGITARLNWKSAADFKGNVHIKLGLRGSHHLSFIPTGKSTSVDLHGPWSNPSFDGEFIPETREIDKESFQAQWNILNYNRPFSQQWSGTGVQLAGSEFGLRLLVPVEQYQKSIRTSKYAHLIIILTFVSLFLVEITGKLRIHPFQYLLIGAALIIYYTLLLSISEQLGFNIAYWIATGAVVALISLYATSFIQNWSTVLLLTGIMSMFYAFIFVIILEQDLSLLLGSIGLFLVIAALMFFSRKIVWYKEQSADANINV